MSNEEKLRKALEVNTIVAVTGIAISLIGIVVRLATLV